MDTTVQRTGTQGRERALRVLRELAARGEFGWRLSDLAARCELVKATAHRVLACLVRERFVQQRASDKHYFPGPMLAELALSVHGYPAFQRAAEARLAKMAQATGAIAWLILRSGHEYVCAVRQGSLQLKGMMVQQGTRRPLFTSVGGAAMLLTLAPDEVEVILADNTQQEMQQRGGGRLAALARMRERSREHGFGVNLADVVPGVNAFGVAVPGDDGRAVAAVCITCAAEQYGPESLAHMRDTLEAGATDIGALMREHLGGLSHPAARCSTAKGPHVETRKPAPVVRTPLMPEHRITA
jgi:DNA-binding IclR family transcriptional regulator